MMPSIIIIGHANIASAPLPQVGEEIDSIQNALNKARQKGYADWREVSDFSFKKLASEFNDAYISSQIRMIHYIGHSNKEAIISQQNGVPTLLEKEDLVAYLKNQKNLKIIFLNSCYSGEIAKELSNAGVPIVVGTTDKVGDHDASLIAAKFYETLGGQAGKTLLAAFEETSIFFKTNPALLSKQYHFRGLKSPPHAQNQEFAWEIYHENATEEVQKWCLLPPKKYILSEASDDSRKKVFCLYGRQIKEYYKPLQLHGSAQLDVITNGVWDINENETPSFEDFLAEWNAANFILHFLDGNYGELRSYIQFANEKNLLSNKQHIFVKIDDTYELAKTLISSIFDENRTFPSSKGIGNWLKTLKAIENTLSANPMDLFQKVFCVELPLFLELQINENTLVSDLESLDFEQEKKNFIAGKPKLFFTLIEGSIDCAQTLLVKTIKKRMGVASNVKIESIKVAGNQSISNELQLIGSLYSMLLKKFPSNFQTMASECAQAILDRKEPFILVFDNIDLISANLYQSAILNQFWAEITQLYQQRSRNNGYQLQYPIMIFVLNYDTHLLSLPLTTDDEAIQIEKISPITPLSESEFNQWYGQKEMTYKKITPEFELNIKNNKTQIVNARRKTAMIKICESISPKFVRIIEDQVLKLS
ncbi:CHAT domain-containing protein [Runella zeae]|uniref:CHAT domain-containing protein n=1 Tax=Runella zeae TaxID=94255 RepID=UPI0012FC8044|nr:CHAT domain-containing protein [Runella zeae]